MVGRRGGRSRLPLPKDALKSAWLDVLTNQFHDTISGCVIPAAIQDAWSSTRGPRPRPSGAAKQRSPSCAPRSEPGAKASRWSCSTRCLGPARAGRVDLELFPRATPSELRLRRRRTVRLSSHQDGTRRRCLAGGLRVHRPRRPGIGYKTYWARAADEKARTPAVR